jgi:hypothetical protein
MERCVVLLLDGHVQCAAGFRIVYRIHRCDVTALSGWTAPKETVIHIRLDRI